MYLWPQGRIVRVVALGLVLAVVADLAITGSMASFTAAQAESVGTKADNATTQLHHTIYGFLFAALAIGVLIGGIYAILFRAKTAQFLIEVDGEMKRVEWPKWPELWKTTVVVALVIVVLGAIIIGIDWLCQFFISGVIHLGGKG